MKRSEAFPSRFVSKEDVEQPKVWTVDHVEKVEMDDDSGGKKQPPVVFFRDEGAKPLILNNVNWMVLEDLYGEDSDNWAGNLIELFKDPTVMFGNKRVGGVRLRPPQIKSREEMITALKDLRGKIVAAGGEKHSLKDTDIDTDDKLAVQLAAHKKQLEELLVKNL